jgi:predicted enzyme related to lactoylglutathione lyase
MGKRTSYPPGTFSWVDLATSDADAAKRFYMDLFGWEMEDADVDVGVYTECRLDGDAVCGLFQLSEEMRAAGVPPSWTSYVTVAGADAAVAQASEAGAEIVNDAFDVMDVGRMAVIKDPQGAVFAVWQPRSRIGAERVNDVGCLCMNELATTDMEAAASFYGELFGWTSEPAGEELPGVWMIFNGGKINGAVMPAPQGTPPHWRPCFTVASAEKAFERVGELGGEQLLEPFDIGHGSLGIARDPQGAVFSIFAGEVDP